MTEPTAPLDPPTDARHAELLAAFAATDLHPLVPPYVSELELVHFAHRLAREHMVLLADLAPKGDAPGDTDQS